MKTKKFTLGLAIMLLFATFSFANVVGENNYEITPLDNVFLGKSFEKVWLIDYSNKVENPITVTLKNNKYVVRSQFFEVMYSYNEDGFGACCVNKSKKTIPTKITLAVLDKEQMKNQRVLTPNKVSEEYAIGLIANYLPELLNDNYKHLIY